LHHELLDGFALRELDVDFFILMAKREPSDDIGTLATLMERVVAFMSISAAWR
jgi:hypothetical protein